MSEETMQGGWESQIKQEALGNKGGMKRKTWSLGTQNFRGLNEKKYKS